MTKAFLRWIIDNSKFFPRVVQGQNPSNAAAPFFQNRLRPLAAQSPRRRFFFSFRQRIQMHPVRTGRKSASKRTRFIRTAKRRNGHFIFATFRSLQRIPSTNRTDWTLKQLTNFFCVEFKARSYSTEFCRISVKSEIRFGSVWIFGPLPDFFSPCFSFSSFTASNGGPRGLEYPPPPA